MRRICVFCGSSPGSHPEYCAATEELGTELARLNIGLVYIVKAKARPHSKPHDARRAGSMLVVAKRRVLFTFAHNSEKSDGGRYGFSEGNGPKLAFRRRAEATEAVRRVGSLLVVPITVGIYGNQIGFAAVPVVEMANARTKDTGSSEYSSLTTLEYEIFPHS